MLSQEAKSHFDFSGGWLARKCRTLKSRLASVFPLLCLLLLVLVCLLPFLGKAFFIDDTLFLRTAEQIQKHPFDFYGFQINWFDRTLPMVESTENPPLAGYYLALAALIGGWHEVTLHLAFLLPALLAVWGTYSLARNYCRHPFLAALVALLTPAFLVSATSVMCDVMLLAFWVWTLVFFERGLQKKGAVAEFVVGGCLAGLAVWAKFFGLALVPLLIAYGLFRTRRAGWWLLAPGLPLLFAAGYEWAGLALYGHDMLFSAAHYAFHSQKGTSDTIWEKTVVGLCFLGGCFLPGLFYTPLLWKRWALYLGLCLMAAGLLFIPRMSAFVWVLWNHDGTLNWIVFLEAALLAVGGFYIFLLAVADVWNRRDAVSLLLFLWFMGVLVFTVGLNWTINARSFLPAVPVLGILVARRLETLQVQANDDSRRCWRWLWPAIPAGAAGLLIANADYNLAGLYKSAAKELLSQYQKPGRTLWFQGHWGFQYYMEQGGARPLETFVSTQPQSMVPVKDGDILVVPAQEKEDYFMQTSTQYRLLEVKTNAVNRSVATMNTSAGAAFYASKSGPFPFAVTGIRPQCFWIYQFSPSAGSSPPNAAPIQKNAR
jgi:4-amino-4-deoxy-L-arabinose transferase-like glycosyltransferase